MLNKTLHKKDFTHLLLNDGGLLSHSEWAGSVEMISGVRTSDLWFKSDLCHRRKKDFQSCCWINRKWIVFTFVSFNRCFYTTYLIALGSWGLRALLTGLHSGSLSVLGLKLTTFRLIVSLFESNSTHILLSSVPLLPPHRTCCCSEPRL